MIKKSVQDEINKQINLEFYSAYFYLSMSGYCDTRNLPGFAKWMKDRFNEEIEHAMRLFNFLIDRGGRIELEAVKKPPLEFGSIPELMQQAYEHEQEVTKKIHHLYEVALKESDFPTQTHLQWFITEQVEEEKMTGQFAEQLKVIKDQKTAFFMLDRQLGAESTSPK